MTVMSKDDPSTSASLSPGHSCPRRRCCCGPVNELTELLGKLRSDRKKAEQAFAADKPEYRMTETEAKMFEDDATLCAATLVRIQVQRDEMGKLMTELRELNELIAIREESASETEKEVGN